MKQRFKFLIILLVLGTIIFYSLDPCLAYVPSTAQIRYLEYYPFGEVKTEVWGSGPNANKPIKHRFNSKELDESTGFYDYGARQYDPIIHRFVSGDTEEFDLDDPQTLNKYSYTLNNPLKYTDPTGNIPVTDIIDVGFFATSFTKFIRAPSKQTAIDLALDSLGLLPLVPSIGSIKLVGKAISKVGDVGKISKAEKASEVTGKAFSRFMSKKEAKVVEKTGMLRGGDKGETFFTANKFQKVSSAQDRLSLEAKPEVRMDFKIKNNPKVKGPDPVKPIPGRRGGGIEYKTINQVKVKIVRTRKLK